MAGRGFGWKLGYMLSGILVWAAHFLFVYGLHGWACARGSVGSASIQATMIGATAVALMLQSGALFAALSGRGPGVGGERLSELREFWRVMTAIIAGLSIVAVIWTVVPVFLVQACA